MTPPEITTPPGAGQVDLDQALAASRQNQLALDLVAILRRGSSTASTGKAIDLGDDLIELLERGWLASIPRSPSGRLTT